MDWQQAQKELSVRLTGLYEDREAATIADWVIEKVSGRRKLDRLSLKSEALSMTEQDRYERYAGELTGGRPVQYVLGESWFYGMKFFVDEQVLIPRPETEELVEWFISEYQKEMHDGGRKASIALDVGTGSGCIAIALKKKLPRLNMIGGDVSPGALAVARRNADELEVDVRFEQFDMLQEDQYSLLPTVDYLISNPPYIPLREKNDMARNVVGFEPSLALFVPDGDPLLFYRLLAVLAGRNLSPGGSLFAEIHEDAGKAVSELFGKFGLCGVTLKKDMQGKDRFIKATR